MMSQSARLQPGRRMHPPTGRPQDQTRRRKLDTSGTPARFEALKDKRSRDCGPVWIAQTKYPWAAAEVFIYEVALRLKIAYFPKQ